MTDWRHRAACRDMADDTFYPLGSEGRAPVAAEERAKAVCAGCTVTVACLAEALVQRDSWGIFGGLTAEERATLLRKPRRPSTTPRIRHVRADAG
jgi:WhiB family redox-sensing transcriptional regulator